MVKQKDKYVQGYLYTGSSDDPNHRTICQIIGRVTEEGSLRENGPMFEVQFGDGKVTDACAEDLTPWFPVD